MAFENPFLNSDVTDNLPDESSERAADQAAAEGRQVQASAPTPPAATPKPDPAPQSPPPPPAPTKDPQAPVQAAAMSTEDAAAALAAGFTGAPADGPAPAQATLDDIKALTFQETPEPRIITQPVDNLQERLDAIADRVADARMKFQSADESMDERTLARIEARARQEEDALRSQHQRHIDQVTSARQHEVGTWQALIEANTAHWKQHGIDLTPHMERLVAYQRLSRSESETLEQGLSKAQILDRAIRRMAADLKLATAAPPPAAAGRQPKQGPVTLANVPPASNQAKPAGETGFEYLRNIQGTDRMTIEFNKLTPAEQERALMAE